MKRISAIRLLFLLISFLLGSLLNAQKKFQIRGALLESDSNSAVPFAYVINLNSSHGVITDTRGNFILSAFDKDSIKFSCVGYVSKVIKVHEIPNLNDSVKVFKKFYVQRAIYDLGMVYVNKFKIKPHEREYMQRVINRPKVQGLNVAQSPITALWQTFSRKGREMQKLELIFRDLLKKEQIEKRLNTDILRKLLNDEHITLEKFRIICPEISDEFILYAEPYELYSQVSNSYERYMIERYHDSGHE